MLKSIIRILVPCLIFSGCFPKQVTNFTRYLHAVHGIEAGDQIYYVLNLQAPCDCVYQHLLMLAEADTLNNHTTLILIGKNEIIGRDSLLQLIEQKAHRVLTDKKGKAWQYGIATLKPMLFRYDNLWPTSKVIQDNEVGIVKEIIGR